jgi:hypothetical protein
MASSSEDRKREGTEHVARAAIRPSVGGDAPRGASRCACSNPRPWTCLCFTGGRRTRPATCACRPAGHHLRRVRSHAPRDGSRLGTAGPDRRGLVSADCDAGPRHQSGMVSPLRCRRGVARRREALLSGGGRAAVDTGTPDAVHPRHTDSIRRDSALERDARRSIVVSTRGQATARRAPSSADR